MLVSRRPLQISLALAGIACASLVIMEAAAAVATQDPPSAPPDDQSPPAICKMFRVDVGNWSECVRLNATAQCFQTRHSSCRREADGALAPWHYCSDRELEALCGRAGEGRDEVDAPLHSSEEVRECPTAQCVHRRQDCVVSMWSPWSDDACQRCRDSDGHGEGPSLRSRDREVVIPSFNGGEACPPLHESAPCDECPLVVSLDATARSYTWEVGEWSDCVALDEARRCGVGLSNRTVRCVDLLGQERDAFYCLEMEPAYERIYPPSSSRLCEAACSCVLSEWTAWSECRYQLDAPSGGMVRQREKAVVQRPTLHLTCPPEAERMETEGCSSEERERLHSSVSYEWQASSWSLCSTVQDGEEEDAMRCGLGTQERFVYCLRRLANDSTISTTNGSDANSSTVLQLVDKEWCEQFGAGGPEPSGVRGCEVPCATDCEVGEWTEWSECEESCVPSTSRRARSLLVRPLAGGRGCPWLEERRACPVLPSCLRWEPQAFGTCIVDLGLSECGLGEQSRNIRCRDLQGRDRQEECSHTASLPGPVPSRYQSCYVPCPGWCVVSDWSPWGACSESCGGREGLQTRTRRWLAHGTECPLGDGDLVEQRSCAVYTEACPDQPGYHLWYGEWGECEGGRDPEGNQTLVSAADHDCSGRQNRSVTCRNEEGSIVALENCPMALSPSEERACVLPCPRDCEMSQWSAFASCSAACGGQGVRVRSRWVLRGPRDGGVACPVLDKRGVEVETVPCDGDGVDGGGGVPCVRWEEGEWGVCLPLHAGPSNLSTCGPGLQGRRVRCVEGEGEGEVADELCHAQPRPASARSCIVPCGDRCVVSEWSQFQPCFGNGSTVRSRSIIPFSGSTDWTSDCPELSDLRLVEEASCRHEYEGEVYWIGRTSFSTADCFYSDESRQCGNGRAYSGYGCYDSTFQPVNASLCQDLPAPVSTQNCHDPCPRDCLTGDWSEWTGCSASCGNGVRVRRREVRKRALRGGRACGPLEEVSACYAEPCLIGQYHATDWGSCVLSNSSQLCGVGTATREVRCLVNGEASVDHGPCALLVAGPAPANTTECSLPCPEQCLAKWGQWSPCSYQEGGALHYTQRQRKILRDGDGCPSVLSEHKPCVEDTSAPSGYEWQAMDWTDCIILPIPEHRSESHYYCGNGTQTRQVACVDAATNTTVPEYYCRSLGGRPASVQACALACPTDCRVSEFSPWSACQGSCVQPTLTQQRWRAVLLAPSHGGRGCPRLNEERPCPPPSDCRQYSISSLAPSCSVDWTQHSMCGRTNADTSFACQLNGKPVAFSRCLEAIRNGLAVKGVEILETAKVDCDTVECPRGPACVFSDWTEWSPCQQHCLLHEGHEGFRVRWRVLLRAVEGHKASCAGNQTQVSACRLPDNAAWPACLDVAWAASQWHNGSRAVWCQSTTDGQEVMGDSCLEGDRPWGGASVPCAVDCSDYASCDSSAGVCACRDGFEAMEGSCLPVVGCALDQHCLLPHTHCNMSSGQCTCEPGLVFDYQQWKCSVPTIPTIPSSSPSSAPPSPSSAPPSPSSAPSSVPPSEGTADDVSTGTTASPGGTGIFDNIGITHVVLFTTVPMVVVIVTVLLFILIVYRCGRHVKAKKNARVVTISSPKQLSREEFVSMSGGGHSATHSICSGYSDNGDHGQFGGPNSTFILGGGGGGYSKVDPLALNGLFPLPPPQYPKNVQVDYPPGVLCLDSPSPSSAARSTHSEPPVSSRPCAGGTGEGGRRRRMRRRRERSPRTSYSPSFSSAHRQSPGGGGGGGASRSVSACSGTAGKHVTASAAHSRGLNPEMSRFRDLELLGYPYAAKGGRQVKHPLECSHQAALSSCGNSTVYEGEDSWSLTSTSKHTHTRDVSLDSTPSVHVMMTTPPPPPTHVGHVRPPATAAVVCPREPLYSTVVKHAFASSGCSPEHRSNSTNVYVQDPLTGKRNVTTCTLGMKPRPLVVDDMNTRPFDLEDIDTALEESETLKCSNV